MTRDELLRKWVDALESGQYPQGAGTLRTLEGKFCCLGVYCEISGKGKWVIDPRFAGGYLFDVDGDAQFLYLPGPWRDALGLSWSDQRDLTNANDRGESFQKIAQRIRAMFPDVFTESVV